jgi:hypothetical protein
MVITSGLAEASPVCCLVADEDDGCCEVEGDGLPQIAGPDCCDDEGASGTAALQDANGFAKLSVGRAARAPGVVVARSPRTTVSGASLAPRGVRRSLAPPPRLRRILATSRFLI